VTFLALAACVGAAAASYESLPERARRGALGAALRKAAPKASAPVTGQFWLDVPLDYDSDASGTFRIRWYINKRDAVRQRCLDARRAVAFHTVQPSTRPTPRRRFF